MNRLICNFILIVVIAIFSQNVAAREISITEALACAQSQFDDRDVDYFLVEQESTDSDVWKIFVDANPYAGWEHEAYILTVYKVSETGNQIKSVIPVKMPPSGTLTALNVNHRKDGVVYHKPLASSMPNGKQGSNEYAANTYAIIISGGGNKNSNSVRYWNDCSFIYRTLTSVYNIPKNHIIPLMADGDNPGADTAIGFGGTPDDYISQSLDLDFDGENEIEVAALKSNVIDALQSMRDVLDENSHLFIYVIDHGGSDGWVEDINGKPVSFISPEQCYICLWNNEKLYTEEFAEELRPLSEKGGVINIVMGQCYSGGFVDCLRNNPINGVSIVSACARDQLSYTYKNSQYDKFVYYWTSAINGETPYTECVYADLSNNGFISMMDAFKYAEKSVLDTNPFTVQSGLPETDYQNNIFEFMPGETPGFFSYPQSIIEDLAFNNIPAASKLHLKKSPYDKGRPMDDFYYGWGGESLRYVSTDEKDVTDEFPGVEGESYVVKVHNRGRKGYAGGDWISLYTMDSSAAYMPGNFASSGNGGNGMLKHNLGSYTIPAIPVDSCWTLAVPNPFPAIGDNLQKWLQCESIVAKIGPNKPASQNPSWQGYDSYMAGDRMALATHAFVPNRRLGSEYSFTIANPGQSNGLFSLELHPVDSRDAALLELARVRIKMGDSLYNNWQTAGSKGQGLSSRTTPNCVDMIEPRSSIERLYLEAGQSEEVSVKFCFTKADSVSRVYRYDLVERDASGRITGGLRFSVQSPVAAAGISETDIHTKETGNGVVMEVEPMTFETVNWVREDGMMTDGQESIEVESCARPVRYDALCITEEGDFVKGSVEQAGVCSIRSISREGFGIKVSLAKPAPCDGRIVVRSVTDNSVYNEIPVHTGDGSVLIVLGNYGTGVLVVTYYSGDDIVDSESVTI